MSTSVIIPSLGRARILGETLKRLVGQTVPAVEVLVIVPSKEDLPDTLPDYVKVIFSEKGSCVQRNTGIKEAHTDSEYLLFIDDDTFLGPRYIEQLEGLFRKHPDIVGLTGNLLKNGDVSVEEADTLLDNYIYTNKQTLTPVGLYGCNFAVKRSAIDALYFDERLVLYGWLEDADYSIRLGQRGRIEKFWDMACVHLMYPSGGRSNHVRFGYSQIMNPYYLHAKNGALFALSEVWRDHWFKAFTANFVKMFVGGDRQMRKDRFKGNVIAFGKIMRRRIAPEYAKEL